MKKSMICWVAAGTLLAAGVASAQTVDASKSTLTFGFQQLSSPVEGVFKTFAIQLDFDPAKLGASKVDVRVKTASADVGSKDGNQLLGSKDFFNVAAFPEAHFIASGFKRVSAEQYRAEGKLTLKGKTAPVSMLFQAKKMGTDYDFTGTGTIKRLQFDVGMGDWTDTGAISDEVVLKFHVILKP